MFNKSDSSTVDVLGVLDLRDLKDIDMCGGAVQGMQWMSSSRVGLTGFTVAIPGLMKTDASG